MASARCEWENTIKIVVCTVKAFILKSILPTYIYIFPVDGHKRELYLDMYQICKAGGVLTTLLEYCEGTHPLSHTITMLCTFFLYIVLYVVMYIVDIVDVVFVYIVVYIGLYIIDIVVLFTLLFTLFCILLCTLLALLAFCVHCCYCWLVYIVGTIM